MSNLPKRNMGGSILPSSDPQILRPLHACGGSFQVNPDPLNDTHTLTFNGSLLASHPNGYSCQNLADRMAQAWAGKRTVAYALEQFDYVIACAGTGDRAAVVAILEAKNAQS